MATFDISTEQPGQQGIGKIWNTAAITSQALTVLCAIAAALVCANFVAGNPMVLFEKATASVIGQTAPPALTGDEIALFRAATHQAEAQLDRAEVQALTRQFQAWAAEVDAKPQVQLFQQPAPDNLRTAVLTKTQSTHIDRHKQPQHKARSVVHHTKHARRHKPQKQYAQALDWFAPMKWSERHSVWFF